MKRKTIHIGKSCCAHLKMAKVRLSHTRFMSMMYSTRKILNAHEILEEWVKEDTTSFHRWLLYHYILHTKMRESDSYLKFCMEAASIQLEMKVIGVGNNSDINEMFTL